MIKILECQSKLGIALVTKDVLKVDVYTLEVGDGSQETIDKVTRIHTPSPAIAPYAVLRCHNNNLQLQLIPHCRATLNSFHPEFRYGISKAHYQTDFF